MLDIDQPQEKRKSKINIGITIVLVIILLITGLMVIRFTMPNAGVSKYMDVIANKLYDVALPNEAEETATRTELEEDKTELIKNKLANNYKAAIEQFEYNAQLEYQEGSTYGLENLVEAKDIQQNMWYKGADGEARYYDEEIIGTIIAFESQKNEYYSTGDKKVLTMITPDSHLYEILLAENNNSVEEKVSLLEIGDIKVAGNSYYVWVAEHGSGETINKIYQIEEVAEKLVLSDVAEV